MLPFGSRYQTNSTRMNFICLLATNYLHEYVVELGSNAIVSDMVRTGPSALLDPLNYY